MVAQDQHISRNVMSVQLNQTRTMFLKVRVESMIKEMADTVFHNWGAILPWKTYEQD